MRPKKRIFGEQASIRVDIHGYGYMSSTVIATAASAEDWKNDALQALDGDPARCIYGACWVCVREMRRSPVPGPQEIARGVPKARPDPLAAFICR